MKYLINKLIFAKHFAVFFMATSVSLFLYTHTTLLAQENERERGEEADILKELDPEMMSSDFSEQLTFDNGDLLWDWGLFTRQFFVNYEDGSGHYLANRYESYRAWGRMSYADTIGAYLRFKTSRRDTRRGDHRGGNHTDRDNVKLDIGYLSFKKSLANSQYVLQAGRYFVSQGSGTMLLKTLDGGRLNFSMGPFKGFVHAGRTPLSTHNQNAAAPMNYRSRRFFKGFEIGYRSVGGWRPYVSVLTEEDHSKERPRNLSQNFHTDFEMFASGFRGELNANWKVSGEYIWQKGRVPLFGSPRHRQSQRSNAYLFNSQYLYENKAIFAYDFIYARGDNDRRSVTAAGNNADSSIGRRDRNFFYFGYVNTGLVYAPRISNMIINHLGLTLTLPEHDKWQVKLDGYNFRRDVSHSTNSDAFIRRNKADLGREADITVEYRPYSNMSILGRYGAFFEGKSYDNGNYSRKRNHSVREYWSIAWSLNF